MKKEFIKIKVDELIPYENNPRINENAVPDTMESIRQCENLDPIEVDENNVILSGHTRLLALKRLGYNETEVVRYTGLTEDQKKKYRILANKVGEKSEWDFSKLEEELADLDFGDFDFGFSDKQDSGNDGGDDGGVPLNADSSFNYQEQYAVTVMCVDEADQQKVYERLTSEGYTCKVVCV